VISVLCTWVILVFAIHFWGRMCLILRLVPLFPLLCLAFACLKFVYGFELNTPKSMNRRMIFKALEIKRSLQRQPKKPNTSKCAKYHDLKRCNKKQWERNDGVSHQTPPWPGRGGLDGQPVAAPFPSVRFFLFNFSVVAHFLHLEDLISSYKCDFMADIRWSFSSSS